MFTTPPLFGYLATTQHAIFFTERGFTAGQASLLLAIGGVLAGAGRAIAGAESGSRSRDDGPEIARSAAPRCRR
jgi:hypothetical protein